MQWSSVWNCNAGILSLNPARFAIKVPMVRKATGNHLVKPTSLGETQSPVFYSALLKIEHAMQLLKGNQALFQD